MPLPRFETTHVMGRLSRDGSSSPVVVETPGGRFVAKLRGAGGGAPALIAELVVAEIAERLGLPVPERVLIDLDAEFQSDDHNDELADLLARSVGLNVGFRWLEGARSPRPEEFARFDEDFVARVLWLDGLTLNPDRTPANPNILVWQRQPWLIDHGAALAFHYDWRQVTEASPREPLSYTGHVFAERTELLPRVDALLAKGSTHTRSRRCSEPYRTSFSRAQRPRHRCAHEQPTRPSSGRDSSRRDLSFQRLRHRHYRNARRCRLVLHGLAFDERNHGARAARDRPRIGALAGRPTPRSRRTSARCMTLGSPSGHAESRRPRSVLAVAHITSKVDLPLSSVVDYAIESIS